MDREDDSQPSDVTLEDVILTVMLMTNMNVIEG